MNKNLLKDRFRIMMFDKTKVSTVYFLCTKFTYFYVLDYESFPIKN